MPRHSRSPPPSRSRDSEHNRQESGYKSRRHETDRRDRDERPTTRDDSRRNRDAREADTRREDSRYGYGEGDRERERKRDRERYDRDYNRDRNPTGSSSRRSASPRSSRRPSRPLSHSRSPSPSEAKVAKPNFAPSGLLAAETNTVQSVDGSNKTVLKYNEPPEARKPLLAWRLYVFKGSEQVGEPAPSHMRLRHVILTGVSIQSYSISIARVPIWLGGTV